MLGIKPGHDMKFISKNYPGMAGKRFSDISKAILDPARFGAFLKQFDVKSLQKGPKHKQFF